MAKALRGLLEEIGGGLDLDVAGPGPGEKGRVIWRERFFFLGGGGILVALTALCFK